MFILLEVGVVEKKDESLKYEIASELELIEKVSKFGWKCLSAKETGRIGGLVAKRKKSLQAANGEQV
jgi:small acid-soluble spore protein F (minor alpha/beta-type SASP)